MDSGVIAALAVAATLSVAAIGALWKVVEYVNRLDERQTDQRHRLRGDFSGALGDTEEKLSRRIDHLEGKTPTERRSRQRRPGFSDGE